MRIFAFLFLILTCFPASLHAEERIHLYDVDIEVSTNGNILVSETIQVTPQGYNIRRGIYRTLPRNYLMPETGETFRYNYKVVSVTRNGKKEPFELSREGNAFNIRIGDADRYLPIGEKQTYKIVYRVKNQIRYDDGFDELYWNVTGTYWDFPMDDVRTTVILPDGASPTFVRAFTGYQGVAGSDYESRVRNNTVEFDVTRPVKAREGLTIGVGLPKGVIEPPSFSDKADILWQRYGALALLLLSTLGVLYFYYRSWMRVGQDAAKLPVFPQYHPPKDLSPAAAHYIFNRGFASKAAFTATLIDLAIKGYMEMKTDKKEVIFTRKPLSNPPQIPNHQKKLFDALLKSREQKVIGKSYDSGFASAYQTFNKDVSNTYGEDYFRWNTAYMAVAVIASAVMLFISLALVVNWTPWHFAAIFALILVNLAFFYFMPAQTRKGEQKRSEIAGLRLYLETAEKLPMNQVDIHGDTPPPMSKDRYEELLPYAIALNVEKPWSKYFEKVLPDVAKDYDPGWYHSGRYASHSLHGFNRSLAGAISSGVATSAVAPSSSSGGGSSGGFSGGGGGGGGGGGW
jgi:uncharacterized membrane protein